MPRATPLAIRQLVIDHFKAGLPKAEIARRTGLNRGTVITITKRFILQGLAGLVPEYHNCGQTGRHTDHRIVRFYRCLRTWHPGYGYDRITSSIRRKYPNIDLPDRRTVYRWWHEDGLIVARSRLDCTTTPRTSQLHQNWQIDAKEKMRTLDGQQCCWLNIVDEGSGTVIDPPVFPP